jgi:imidazolonepropionase
MPHADVLFRNAAELVPLTDGPAEGGVRGAALDVAAVMQHASIAVKDGRIAAVGPDAEMAKTWRAAHELDLSGYVVVPGLVDCHTHPVFAATREQEFAARTRGADYVEIARMGGGILSSVQALRAMPFADLQHLVEERLRRFLLLGTTAIEAKSGYGLSTEAEKKSLQVVRRAAEHVPITVRATCLAAHEVPPEFRGDPDGYVKLLIEETLPACRDLAEACDVFVEAHVFGIEQARAIGTAAKRLGYRLRLHVDEIEPMCGAELAVELGADSADHLGRISDEGIARLAASATTAVLLPGTTFFLRKKEHAPARRLIEAGALVALASDFNPGSCYTQSLPMIATLARLFYGMTPAECLNAMTRNAAASLGLSAERGTLHAGKAADFVALDLPSFAAFGYAFGDNPVVMTVKDGRPVALNSGEVDAHLLERLTE